MRNISAIFCDFLKYNLQLPNVQHFKANVQNTSARCSEKLYIESKRICSVSICPSDRQMVRHTALKLSRIDPCGIFYKTVRAFCDWFASLGSALVNFWPNLQAAAM